MAKPKVFENKIYAAIIATCEGIEHKGMYRGNGHHLAQKLCVKVAEAAAFTGQQKKIYEALTTGDPATSKQIGEKVGLSSKHVSTQLKNMHDKTTLIAYKSKGKIKSWYRYYATDY